MTKVLSEFDEDVIFSVTDPGSGSGIVRSLKFMPSVAEVLEACEAAAKRIAAKRKIDEMEAAGFFWVNAPALNLVGFYNAAGVAWHERNRIAPPATPVGEQRMAEIGLAPARATSARAFEPRDDGRHGERVAAELARRAAQTAQTAQSTETTETAGKTA